MLGEAGRAATVSEAKVLDKRALEMDKLLMSLDWALKHGLNSKSYGINKCFTIKK